MVAEADIAQVCEWVEQKSTGSCASFWNYDAYWKPALDEAVRRRRILFVDGFPGGSQYVLDGYWTEAALVTAATRALRDLLKWIEYDWQIADIIGWHQPERQRWDELRGKMLEIVDMALQLGAA